MKHRHFKIHKPYGYLSQFVLPTNQKMKLLGELYDFPDDTMSIGRLDKRSEGLLLLTTDGKVSAQINSSKFEKEYHAQVDGIIHEKAMNQLRNGLELRIKGVDLVSKPCTVNRLDHLPNYPRRARWIRDDRHGPTSWISIILREGKFKQVRKMTAAVGFPTLRLLRVRVGDIQLGSMRAGEVIEVDSFFKSIV
ncbi:MAG: pseudouridine synthase [Bacteroidota bacterium]